LTVNKKLVRSATMLTALATLALSTGAGMRWCNFFEWVF